MSDGKSFNKQDNANMSNVHSPELECQFYVVLGKHDREFHSDEKSRYFMVSGNEDIHLIGYAFGEEWKKKRRDHIKVASEVIFLIPSEEYRDLAQNLMDQLNFRGEIQLVPSLHKDNHSTTPEIKSDDLEIQELKEESEVDSLPEIHENTRDESQSQKLDDSLEFYVPREKFDVVKKAEENHDDISSNQDHVYHGDFVRPVVDEADDVSSYMWGNDKKKSSGKKLVRKKSTGFIDLPVIIFILSALLLIGAIVLLFVLK